jgi:hypothetical protein
MPGWLTAGLAGLALGLALLANFSWVTLPFLWLLIALMSRLPFPRGRRDRNSGWQFLLEIVLIGGIALDVVNTVYCFEDTLTPLGDFQFSSRVLQGPDDETTRFHNRFRGTSLASIPIPLPSNYVRGIDERIRHLMDNQDSSDTADKTAAERDLVPDISSLMAAIPISLGILALLAILFPSLDRSDADWLDQLPVLLPPLAVVTIIALLPERENPVPRILPAVPFFFIWIAQVGRAVAPGRTRTKLVIALLVWYTINGLWAYWSGFR